MLAVIAFLLLVMAAGCAHDVSHDARAQQDTKSPSYQAGKVAHRIAKETGKVAAAAGRRIGEDARKAREGWKEQGKEDREKAAAAQK